jgi:uncharacterized protein YndB with AHSA1/START domain
MAEATGKGPGDRMRAWAGHRLDEIDGDGVGKVEGVFVDEQTGKPEWVLARTVRFGHHTLVPARDAVEGVGPSGFPIRATRFKVRRRSLRASR